MRLELALFTFISLLIAIRCCYKCEKDLLVELPTGTIQGRKEMNRYRQTLFFAFLQIPYAEPPIGALRFMAPKPAKKWDGVLDCRKNNKICHQGVPLQKFTTEDCLYLNVYTPKNYKNADLLPVIFHIHGGSFMNNAGIFDNWGPHYLLKRNVVVVTANYRLGIFGFLSTGDEVMPGNAAMKDQVLALEWVQTNIHLFGGDPTKVTITGNSAGAAAVSYHVLSKKSAGLFRAAVQFSGSALCPWALQRNPRHHAVQIGALISKKIDNNTSSRQLLQVFQSLDERSLSSLAAKYLLGVHTSEYEMTFEGLIFAPVVEPDTPDAFFTGKSYEQLETGDFNRVPLILGICSEEGLMFEIVVKMKSALFDSKPALLTHGSFHIDDEELRTAIGREIKEIYTDASLKGNPAAGIRLFSDYAFNRAVIKNAQLQSRYTDVFLYQFSYAWGPKRGVVDDVGHDDDTRFLWKAKYGAGLSWEEMKIMKRYVGFVVDFAVTLNPTPLRDEKYFNAIWPKVDGDYIPFLNINRSMAVREDLKEPYMSKWFDLFEKYAVKPYDTV